MNLGSIRHKQDVIFYSSVGMAFTGDTPEAGGMGGSELEVVVLAEALAARGYQVTVVNPTREVKEVKGVIYLPLAGAGSWTSCRTLVVMRYSPVPPIAHEKLVIIAMDMPGDGAHNHQAAYLRGRAPHGVLVTMTDWQRSLFPQTWNMRTVHPVVPDVVYEIARRNEVPKMPKRFLYASAALKGLSETVRTWSAMKAENSVFAEAELVVTSPGYDVPVAEGDGVILRGVIPSFSGVVEALHESAGLFYVNTFPENFSLTMVMAEALGRRTHVLCLNGLGGSREAIRSPLLTDNREKFLEDFAKAYASPEDSAWYASCKVVDCSADAMMPEWIDVLGVE